MKDLKFDYEEFVLKSCYIVIGASQKSFTELAAELRLLRRAHCGLRSRLARNYIRNDINRRLVTFAVDTEQSREVVDFLYGRAIRYGFNSLSAEVSAALDYASYFRVRGDIAQALAALTQTRAKIETNQTISDHSKEYFLKYLIDAIRLATRDR